jgi:hypothetical protein
MARPLLIMLLAGSFGFAGCDDGTDADPTEVFRADLTGAAERPNPVTTNATGDASVTWDPRTSTFSYTLNVSDITGVVASHIHGPATADAAAGVLVTLQTPSMPSVSGTFTAADNPTAVPRDSLLTLLRGGLTYVNVHTSANPGGEIRGQLLRQ